MGRAGCGSTRCAATATCDAYLAALGDPAGRCGRSCSGSRACSLSRATTKKAPGVARPRVRRPAVRAIVVVKELPVGEFRLVTVARRPRSWSRSPTSWSCTLTSRARLRITLDTAELLLRSADGEILGDRASAALRQEIEGFGNRLRLQPARSVRIVDGAGRRSPPPPTPRAASSGSPPMTIKLPLAAADLPVPAADGVLVARHRHRPGAAAAVRDVRQGRPVEPVAHRTPGTTRATARR